MFLILDCSQPILLSFCRAAGVEGTQDSPGEVGERPHEAGLQLKTYHQQTEMGTKHGKYLGKMLPNTKRFTFTGCL